MSDTLARLAQKHGVDVVYEAAKEWVAYVDRQRAIMVKHGMAEPDRSDGAVECPDCVGEPFDRDDYERHRQTWHPTHIDGTAGAGTMGP